MAEIFKAYDIRGVYGEDLTDEIAYKLGRAFAFLVSCNNVVVGNDMRPHSDPLTENLTRGLIEQGVDVIQLGLCSTPMSYYANGKLEADASIMVTASHNPGEYNGFKLCREQAIPISSETGIQELKRIIQDGDLPTPANHAGSITHYDILPEYKEHIQRFSEIRKPLHIAIDYANAMGIYEGKVFEGLFDFDPLFDIPDGTFPNHEANPLDPETYHALQEKVRNGKYDFGIAFDGDADRVGFVDENGDIISMDMITTLIASSLLKKEKGPVLYDLRSSWTTKEVISQQGGTPIMSRVGHAFIKQKMRETNAIFAGELSGHYYFRENYFTESSALATIYIANLVSQSEKKLSELIAPLKRYSASGEINSTVSDPQKVFLALREKYKEGTITELDGLRIEYPDWWFNVRSSNTEPLLRLNLEAKTPRMMEKKRDEILTLIRNT